MKIPSRVISIIASAMFLVGITAYGLVHGYFDHGKFEVLTVQQSACGRLAMVARRSDHDALNGDRIFVLLGDHLYSSAELKHALYRKSEIFSTDRACLTLKWPRPDRLEITCTGEFLASEDINWKQHQDGKVTITYFNIADVDSK